MMGRSADLSLLCVQVLGEKPELSESQADDTETDASSRKAACLYKVTNCFSPGSSSNQLSVAARDV